jgi:hypothetical protein
VKPSNAPVQPQATPAQGRNLQWRRPAPSWER